MTFGSLFAGIGGFDLGLERAGMGCRWQVENNPYCLKVLEKHWPGVKRYGDIRSLDGGELEPVDLICGGFPCQDLSVAGKRAGIDGVHSGLWAEFARLVGEVRPRYVCIENTPGLLANGAMRRVLGDLSALWFDAEWTSVRASNVGTTQRRERVFIVAYASISRREARRRGAGGSIRNEARRSEPDGPCDCDAVENTARHGQQGQNWQGGGSGRRGVCETGEQLADAVRERRQQDPGSTPGYEKTDGRAGWVERQQDGDHELTGQGADFPPGPDDHEAWRELLVREPWLRPAISQADSVRTATEISHRMNATRPRGAC